MVAAIWPGFSGALSHYRWLCSSPDALRMCPLLGSLQVRFGPHQPRLSLHKRPRPCAREALIAFGKRGTQTTFASLNRRPAAFPDRRGALCLSVLATDERASFSFDGAPPARGFHADTHSLLVTLGAEQRILFPTFGGLRCGAVRLQLRSDTQLFAGETPGPRVAARQFGRFSQGTVGNAVNSARTPRCVGSLCHALCSPSVALPCLVPRQGGERR
jgi:hypothetical protein